jgi:serine/threonine protein kinase
MGEVYRARDTKLGRDVAIKVIADRVASDLATLSRLQREARTLASLNHPNIVTIYAIGSSKVGFSSRWSWWRGARWRRSSRAEECRSTRC